MSSHFWFWRKCFYFFPIGMMLVINLSFIIFIMLKYDPFISCFIRGVFIMEGCWLLSKHVFFFYRDDHVTFVLNCIYVLYCLLICVCWLILASLEWNYLDHGVWSFFKCWVWFVSTLLWIFASMFTKEIWL
jgi:hypothetical protein